MKSANLITLTLVLNLSILLVAPTTSRADYAAWVGGDIKVEGLWFSGDPSKTVIRKPSDFSAPWTILGSDIYYLIGNVGIGTMTPSTKLDVDGTVKATSFIGDAAGLTNISAAIPDNSITDAKISGPVSASKIDLSGVQKKYGRVAVVARSGGDYSDPVTALAESGTWCNDPSSVNACLLKIMPGVYTVTSPVVMRQFIDIEGSGENVTKITSALSSPTQFFTVATVIGADNSELRFLTVENTSTGDSTVAILNLSASPSILHVSAISNGAIYFNYAIRNELCSPTLTNVRASAIGSSSNYAISNGGTSTIMTNVTATATGGINTNTGITNAGGSPNMTNVTVTAKGGAICYGVRNTDTGATMTNATVTVSGGTQNIGVYCFQAYPTMTNATITASGGTNNVGVSNSGVNSQMAGTVKIHNSVIKGTTNTIANAVGGTILVGNSQLDGGASAGIVKCAGVYDGDYNFYASTCP